MSLWYINGKSIKNQYLPKENEKMNQTTKFGFEAIICNSGTAVSFSL